MGRAYFKCAYWKVSLEGKCAAVARMETIKHAAPASELGVEKRVLYNWRDQLRRRGHRRNESGAFLLTPQNRDDGRLTSFVCYDDLDPDAYKGGAMAFHAIGHVALWELCERRGLRTLADVHTHLGRYIRQRPTDEHNPMISIEGHRERVSGPTPTPWTCLQSAIRSDTVSDPPFTGCRAHRTWCV